MYGRMRAAVSEELSARRQRRDALLALRYQPAMFLRACYGISGTACCPDVGPRTGGVRMWREAMDEEDSDEGERGIAYALLRDIRVWRYLLTRCQVLRWRMAVVSCAMPGTEIAHGRDVLRTCYALS
eukprot:490505-Rhodomonas_salina.1